MRQTPGCQYRYASVDGTALLAEEWVSINLDIKPCKVTWRRGAAYHDQQYDHFARPAR